MYTIKLFVCNITGHTIYRGEIYFINKVLYIKFTRFRVINYIIIINFIYK